LEAFCFENRAERRADARPGTGSAERTLDPVQRGRDERDWRLSAGAAEIEVDGNPPPSGPEVPDVMPDNCSRICNVKQEKTRDDSIECAHCPVGADVAYLEADGRRRGLLNPFACDSQSI
jgi:hypothetical protein